MDGLDQLGTAVGGGGSGGIGDILKGILGLGGASGGTAPSPLWMKLLTGGLFGSGEIGNIIEEKKRADYQNMLMSVIKDPAKLTQMILKAERPIDNALVQNVTNRVQGDVAQRGLSQAPGIFAAEESQAIAPIQQQNYNTAMDQVLRSLGLPSGTFSSPTNMGPALQAFLRTFGSGGGGGGGSWGSMAPIGGSTWPSGLTPPDNAGDFNLPADVYA